jgi:protein-disulfide isomerase
MEMLKRSRVRFPIALVGGLFLLIMLSGCSGQPSAAAQGQAAPPAGEGVNVPEVLATIGDAKITMADIRTRVGDDLDHNQTRFIRSQYALIEKALNEILKDRVLLDEARRQGKTLDELVTDEIGSALEPSDLEIEAWYRENQAKTGGRSLDQIRPQIVDYLRKEKRDQAAEKLEKRVHQERQVKVYFEPYRLTFSNEGAPTLGPANAPVTLVEFSDFQCPFCARFAPTLRQLEKNYGDKLRIVYRQYPITSLHPQAYKAAEASLCANDQGRFWDIHDLMFQEQNRLSVRDLKVMANRLGLDQKKFDSCIDTGRYADQVQTDLNEGARVGVNGTPAIFVNGIGITGGAVAYEVVAKVIDRELERVQR